MKARGPELAAKRAAQRARLEARRAAMKRQLLARRAAARAALERRRANLKKPKKKRDRRWLWLLLLLLLVLLKDCSCDEPPAAPAPAPAPEVPTAAGEGSAAPPPPAPPPKIKKRSRPGYAPTAPGPLPWLDALRLQVAARGPRLAACFTGASRPGALRWTASVDPGQGLVSDQGLEPVLDTDPLTREQRDCALGVLAEPPYRLIPDGAEPSTPARIGLVVEF